MYTASAAPAGCVRSGMAKTGATPWKIVRTPAAVALASATGTQRARTELEEEQLDGEQDGRNGAAERRRHTGSGARGEQRLALVCRRVHELPDQRPQRAAGRDDRAFRAERAARADRNRRAKRLEEGHSRRNSTLVGEHVLHRFGNAVPANGA